MPDLEYAASTQFWSTYQALPQHIRDRADKQFALLTDSPQHPSLQFKKLGERNGNEVLVCSRDTAIPCSGDQTAERVSMVLDWRPQDLRLADRLKVGWISRYRAWGIQMRKWPLVWRRLKK